MNFKVFGILLLILLQSAVFGSTYYLSTTGNNVNNGSKEAPFGTINYAASALKAGDTLLIRAGTYYPTGPVRPGAKNGAQSESERITVKAYPGEEVWIDGKNFPAGTQFGIISIDNYRSYITIEGLKLRNGTWRGIDVSYYSTNAIIRNNYIEHTASSGIKFSSAHNSIAEGNEIYKCTNKGDQESLTVSSGSDSVVIKNNHIHHGGGPDPDGYINGIGIDVKDGCTNIVISGNHIHDQLTNGIYIDARGRTENVQIYNNYVHDNASHGIKIGNETSEGGIFNTKIYNNISVRNLVGITIGQNQMPPNNIQHLKVVNNVVLQNRTAAFWLMTQSDETRFPGVQAKDILIANNIIMGNIRNQFEAWGDNIHLDEYTIDNNIIIGQTNNVGQTNTITEDPLFINPSTDDFHLNSGSSAIGKAKNDQANFFKPDFDFDGVARGTPDNIGIFGFSGITNGTVTSGTNNGTVTQFILDSIDKTLRASPSL